MKPITLYDENHMRVGDTYPRRAKQLVRSGRAMWIEFEESLKLISTTETHTPPGFIYTPQEEVQPMEEVILNTNEAMDSPKPVHSLADELLLTQAKKNVAERKYLIKNAIIYLLTWMIGTFVFFELMLFGNPRVQFYGGPSDAFWEIQRMHDVIMQEIPYWQPNFVLAYMNEMLPLLERAEATTVWHSSGSPSLWYIFVGIMIAWTAWLVNHAIKYARKRAANSKKSSKPDPVILEYQRLKRLAE